MGKNYGKKVAERAASNRNVVGNSFADLGTAAVDQVDLDLDAIEAAQKVMLSEFQPEIKALDEYNKQVKKGDIAWDKAGKLHAEYVEMFSQAKTWMTIITAQKAFISKVEFAFDKVFRAPENIRVAKAWIGNSKERAEAWAAKETEQREAYVLTHCEDTYAELAKAKEGMDACNAACAELEHKIDVSEIAANKAYRAADKAVADVGMTAKSWVQGKSHFAHRSVKGE